MNKKTLPHGNRMKNQRGAALMIALITAVIVMLAATLLISLTERMVNAHQKRIVDAQISLSETSAADGLAYLLETEGAGSSSLNQSFELAGVTTEFTLAGTGSAGIRSGFYQIDDPDGTVFVPCGNGLLTASISQEGNVVFVYFDNETFQPVSRVSLNVSMHPVTGAPLISESMNGAVFVLRGDGETMLCAVTGEGVVASSTPDFVYTPSGCHLSAAVSENGTPLLITTNGANLGSLYNVQSGEAFHLSSPVGTCPVFMDDGSLFGTISGSSSSLGFARVRDVFSGDFNSDGTSDMAFATSYSLTGVSGLTGDVYSQSNGGSLVCWGDIQGRTGLVGMWSKPDGSEEWFRLGWDGFTEFTPENICRMGWEGRFTGRGNTFTGFIDDRAVVVSSSGYMQEMFEDDAFTGDSDGGDLDFMHLSCDGLEAFFNPLAGDGLSLTFETVNTFRNTSYPGNTYIFKLYQGMNGLRVFHSIEGVNR